MDNGTLNHQMNSEWLHLDLNGTSWLLVGGVNTAWHILLGLVWPLYLLAQLLKRIAEHVMQTSTGAFWWIWDFLVIIPLHAYYFEAMHEGLPYAELCARFTQHTEASFWSKSEVQRAACEELLDRQFHSFKVTVLLSVYFGVAALILIRVMIWLLCFKLFKK